MNIANLIEPASAAIVFGGTVLGTVLRSGWTDCRMALDALPSLLGKRFDGGAIRAAVASQLREIQQDGLVRADPAPFGDAEFDEAIELLLSTQAASAILDSHERHKEARQRIAERAVGTVAQAAELAPVFGLAATLVSLSQLPTDGLGHHSYMGAISMAVSATLYGIMLANLILIPLGRAMERGAMHEEIERHSILVWFLEQMTTVLPQRQSAASMEALAA